MLYPPSLAACMIGASFQFSSMRNDDALSARLLVLFLTILSVVGVDIVGKSWWDKTTGSKSITTGTRSTDYLLIAAFTAWTQGICFVPGLVHATRTVVFVIAIGVMSYFEMMHRLRSKRRQQSAAVDEVPADKKSPDSTDDGSPTAPGADTK